MIDTASERKPNWRGAEQPFRRQISIIEHHHDQIESYYEREVVVYENGKITWLRETKNIVADKSSTMRINVQQSEGTQ